MNERDCTTVEEEQCSQVSNVELNTRMGIHKVKLREAIIRKKILFYEKISQTGGGGHLVFIPLIFFKGCVESPLCGDHKLEGQLLISAKRRFPKPTNPCRNLKIFIEENTLKKIVMTVPSVARKKAPEPV